MSTSPKYHKCDLPTLDYSKVNDGLIVCTECHRRWALNPHTSEWWPNPCPECNISAKLCRHYGKRQRKKN